MMALVLYFAIYLSIGVSMINYLVLGKSIKRSLSCKEGINLVEGVVMQWHKLPSSVVEHKTWWVLFIISIYPLT